jgi:hypothetical protein
VAIEPIVYIVILAAAVLFLSNIFRGEKENHDPKRPRPIDRPRSQEANVDRFLEEINRRRREANDRRGAPVAPPIQAPSPRRLEPPRPQPAKRASSIPAETRVRRPAPAPRPREEISSRIGRPAPPTATPVTPVVLAPLEVPEAQPRTAAPAPAAAKVIVHPPAPATARLLPLLHSRQALRSAILLQEILSPPLARRRRRRIG